MTSAQVEVGKDSKGQWKPEYMTDGEIIRTGRCVSGNLSSVLRKRALRQLGREQPAAYNTHYEIVLSEIPGLTRHQARGRALTRLRHEFPDRYLELYALEQCGMETDIAPDIRSKSWQRASARLADLCEAAHQGHYAEFRFQGMPRAKAWERAVASIRQSNADLFTRLLSEEYSLWIAAPTAGASTECGTRL